MATSCVELGADVAAALPVLRSLITSLVTTAAPDTEERTALANLETLLRDALAAVRQVLVHTAEAELAKAESNLDTSLLDSLASMSLARPEAIDTEPIASARDVISVGDAVYAKGMDRSIAKGLVVRIEHDLYWVKGGDGQEVGYPSKSVKRRGNKVATAARADAVGEAEGAASKSTKFVEFKLSRAPQKAKSVSSVRPAPPAPPVHSAPAAPATSSALATPATLPTPPAPPPPHRMPRLIVAVDTNELLVRGGPVDLRDHLLQRFRSRSCDVLVAKQVLDELDGRRINCVR